MNTSIPREISRCDHCKGNWKSFRHLNPEEMNVVSENRFDANFRPGEVMIKQGSPASHALFMANGLAKIYVEGADGRNFMSGIALPGRIILSPGSFVNSRNNFSVAAITAVQTCFVSVEIIRQMVRVNGRFAESMLEELSENSIRLHTRIVNQARKRMSGRLADTLLYFADEIFRKDEFEMILSRQELGEMANMAKECVVRILREFEDSGIIMSESSKIKITDRKKLILISEKG